MYKLTANKKELEKYLKNRQWLSPAEQVISTEKPGEGNMNFTLRVQTKTRSFILKQSRDYVEKYPQVPAPEERVLREAEFYGLTADFPALKKRMPNLLHLDKENHVMCLEDLDQAKDYTFLYQNGETLSEPDLEALIDFSATLPNQITTKTTKVNLPNRAMRELNYEHIFNYPYLEDNGLNLDEILPGLQAVADPFKNDDTLHNELKKLGKLYLADGEHLLHGDYFPGSWLKTNKGIKIIDPEFCFFGIREFEMGVFLAHLKMADQPEELLRKAINLHTIHAPLDKDLCEKFTAVEILRRILGLAQLPLEINLTKRKALVMAARKKIIS